MDTNTKDHYQNKMGTSHSDKRKHKPHQHKDKVNEMISDTCTPKHTPTQTDDTPDNTDIDSYHSTVASASNSE